MTDIKPHIPEALAQRILHKINTKTHRHTTVVSQFSNCWQPKTKKILKLTRIRVIADFSLVTRQAVRPWGAIFKVLTGKKTVNPEFSVKIVFKT